MIAKFKDIEGAEYLEERKLASIARKLEARGYASSVICRIVSEVRGWRYSTGMSRGTDCKGDDSMMCSRKA